MFSIARLGFVREIIRAHVSRCIDLYQEGLLLLYEYELDESETYEKANKYIEETLLQSEINNFTKILVKMEHNCFYTPLQDISTIVRYLEIAKGRENFIVEVNAILSNSPADIYSQTEIDNFIKEAQAKNGIVCGALPDYVRCLQIYSIYYRSHPIFYHLLNRLIRINTLSLEQIRKFI